MKQTIYQVDAFTSEPFKGNPAAVCVLEKTVDEQWMRNVALEMNLSETAFLIPQKDGYSLRWFTPAVEVDLCGHATLAASHVLYETGVLAAGEPAVFYTKSGRLTAAKKGGQIELDFPATPAREIEYSAELVAAIGAEIVWIGKNDYDYLVQVRDEETVKQLFPDFGLLKKLTERGVIVTSASTTDEFDFVSRFFAPAAGIEEDPVTGSAHCTLGPFWAEQMGKIKFTAFQASKRGGIIHVHVKDNRIALGGTAVTVLKGELYF